MNSDLNPEAQSYQPDLFLPQIESQNQKKKQKSLFGYNPENDSEWSSNDDEERQREDNETKLNS